MSNAAPTMLVIAPHPDDSILGAGGIMARFAERNGEVTVLTIAAHMPPLYSSDTFHMTVEEAQKAHSLIGVKESIFLNIPALSLTKMEHHELNGAVSDVVRRVKAGIILVPFFDRHVDHRAIFDSVMVATRPPATGGENSIIAAYEVLSSTHYNAPNIEPNFIPDWVVDISDVIDLKLKALKCCTSQIGPVPHPRSCEAIRAVALFRGSQAGMAYGEGFQIIRMTLPPERLV